MEPMKTNCNVLLSFFVSYIVMSLFILPTKTFCSENTASSLDNRGLKIIEDKNHIGNVFVLKGNKWQNLTRFSSPHHIYAYGRAYDWKYAFVWNEVYPPRVLAIYDLQTMELVKNVLLGFGGDVKWNQENNIIHVYGCGSDCMVARLLTIGGETLFKISGPQIDISPSGRYLLLSTINWVGQQNAELYDLFRKDLVIRKKPLLIINAVGDLDSINWNDERRMTITYTDANFENDNYTKRELSVDLTKY